MFGVLVVEAAYGRIGWLRAFSGMLGGTWHVGGYAPPLFDAEAIAGFWPAGEAKLAALELERRAAVEEAAPVRHELEVLLARHDAELAELRARHAENRRRRARERRDLADPAALHAIDQQSRGDAAEKRRLRAAHLEQRERLESALAAFDRRRETLERERADRSRALWERIHGSYVISNARGERRSLAELFSSVGAPPGGAGDCAGPKLLGLAYREGLRPIALAEMWWGAPPPTGGRLHGAHYPACRGKCGPILAHMLGGLAADAPPVFDSGGIAAGEPRVVYEDRWIIVVDKPCGLLSVPGRGRGLEDSVLTRLRARLPDASGPLLVHRLDLDTSGLLLAAKDIETYRRLQRMFAERAIDKRYVAWLEGEVPPGKDGGTIELALRVDVDDRPRQIHDPIHGKRAITEWRVLERSGGRTKVALCPRTGRTHQLRVHAAHALGIGAPIAGDRLYGRREATERLMLHAEALRFVHPHTGEPVELVRPAPF